MWKLYNFGGKILPIATLGIEGDVAAPEILKGGVIFDAGFVPHLNEKGSITTDGIDGTRIPQVPDCVLRQDIWKQFDMIPMRMAEDDMVDGGWSQQFAGMPAGGLHRKYCPC